ncbi:trypsin-like serine protease [Vulgatibacter incomptus]|uniref:trypsin-like serine protease n=1 Tax=Vulgatibacter incomptus TaxID=1391653 RepID=UPI0012F80A9C
MECRHMNRCASTAIAGIATIFAIIAGACGASTTPATDSIGTVGNALTGPGVETYDGSTAQQLETIDGIAGTVVEIGYDQYVSGMFAVSMRCTGVLVARDRVLTSALCISDPKGPSIFPPSAIVVALPKDGDPTPDLLFVSDVWIAPGSGGAAASSQDLAVIKLQEAVDPTRIEQVAPVFLGDIESALADGTLVADGAFVAGFGPDCLRCDGHTVWGHRRMGALGSPVRLEGSSGHPWLKSRVPANPGVDSGAIFAESPDPGIDGLDRGGPLFLRDSRSGRYVVVGTYVGRVLDLDGTGESFGFTYLGRAGDVPSFDHAEAIRPFLGDFTDGEPCPSESDQRHLGTVNSNLDAEEALGRTSTRMKYLADRCDPVPLVVFGESVPRTRGTSDPLSFTARSWIGNGALVPDRMGGLKWSTQRMC